MVYDILCDKCGKKQEWICSIAEYEKRLKVKCDCGGQLFQSMVDNNTVAIFKGTGWTRSSSGVHGQGYFKEGSVADQADAEKETEMLDEKVKKDPLWKKSVDLENEAKAKYDLPE